MSTGLFWLSLWAVKLLYDLAAYVSKKNDNRHLYTFVCDKPKVYPLTVYSHLHFHFFSVIRRVRERLDVYRER